MVAPTGQYDLTRLINLGANRWSFKPELGLSRAWGQWALDGYASVWLFTENPDTLQKNSRVGVTASFPVGRHQSLKVSYAQGAYIRFGDDFRVFSAAWQYSWIGRTD